MILKRVLASAVDFASLSLYGLLLYAVFSKLSITPTVWQAQALGFCTLTLPVFLYFYLSERSTRKATFGKQLMGLQVASEANDKHRVLLRNLIKFLPWELAHTGVYQIIYLSNNGQSPSWGVWWLLIVPQILVLVYFVSLWYSKGQRSLYDVIAKTSVRNFNAETRT